MRTLITAAAGAALLAGATFAAPAPAMAHGVECTYFGPISDASGTYYYVTRRVSKPNGGYVATLSRKTREPKNCEYSEGT
jgi:hypothetical protein